MSIRRLEDHKKGLLRDAQRALAEGNVDKLREIVVLLERIGEYERAACYENHIKNILRAESVMR